MSPYAFMRNNPVKYIDPTGMSAEDPSDGNPPPKVVIVETAPPEPKNDRLKPQQPPLTPQGTTPQGGTPTPTTPSKSRGIFERMEDNSPTKWRGFNWNIPEGQSQENRTDGNAQSLDGSGFVSAPDPLPGPVNFDNQSNTSNTPKPEDKSGSVGTFIYFVKTNRPGGQASTVYRTFEGSNDSILKRKPIEDNPNAWGLSTEVWRVNPRK
jgi:hypothetical protein